MKTAFLVIIAAALGVLIVFNPFSKASVPFDMGQDLIAPSLEVDSKTDLSHLKVHVQTNRGAFEIAFYAHEAPQNVSRFLQLVKLDFYNGMRFFRADGRFLVQTGDPNGDGTGGTGLKIPAEFSRRVVRLGTVAMARLPADPHSADSQFFITLDQFPHLNRSYTVIGEVVSGIDVVKSIQVGDQMLSLRILL